MALVKCKECNKEISSSVKVCPHCGYKKGLSKKAWVLIIIIMIFIFLYYLNNIISTSDEVTNQNINRTLTDVEKNIFNIYIEEYKRRIIENDDISFLRKDIIDVPDRITADKLQRQYEKNEVQADELYKNKYFIINAQVQEIRKDAFNNIVLSVFGGSNMFIHPLLTIKDEYVNWASNLKKGSKITVVCRIDRAVIGSVMASNCAPLREWIDSQKMESKILKIYKDNKDDKNNLVSLVKRMSKIIPENSKCSSNNLNQVECSKEINKALKKID